MSLYRRVQKNTAFHYSLGTTDHVHTDVD